jgi:uncharacterized protein YdbL (DUF1318 family)
MNKLAAFNIAAVFAALTACVTINVYFPAAAAEKAADRVIDQVIGPTKPDKSAAPTSGLIHSGAGLRLAMALDRVLSAVVSPAYAQADLDVTSAASRQITESMHARHAQLEKYYDSGAIGYTADGLIDVRDATSVGLAERNPLRKLVADENKDRLALYAEIAKANGHPEWESNVRDTFAKRWVAKAKAGWYYKDESGAWKQK